MLQNLANHVLFKKEAHMGVFNDFLTGNFERSRELALRMASLGPYMEGEAVEFISFLKDSDKHKLHSLLWSNNDRIASYAASTRWMPIPHLPSLTSHPSPPIPLLPSLSSHPSSTSLFSWWMHF